MTRELTEALRCDDLSWHSEDRYSWIVGTVEEYADSLHETVCLVETEFDGPAQQCLLDDYEYSPDGCSWRWVPLMHGPVCTHGGL